jgi:hypothetical protein
MSWIAQERNGSGHDRGTYNGSTAMKETRTLNIYPIHRSSSGSQYLKTMVEATTEHLRLIHTTTIEASKLSQQLPPQSYLKVIQRTHHREKYTLLSQKSALRKVLSRSL